MTRRLLVSCMLLSACLSGCTPFTTKPIPLTSSDFDLSPLVGVWRGNFNSVQTGRSGTIAFTLRAGESAAAGNVVMFARPDSLLTPAERDALGNPDAASRQVLRIRFIRKDGGNLAGTLDPYQDPDCACSVTSTFEGKFTDANTIEGTYTVVPSQPGRNVASGSWHVTRVRKL